MKYTHTALLRDLCVVSPYFVAKQNNRRPHCRRFEFIEGKTDGLKKHLLHLWRHCHEYFVFVPEIKNENGEQMQVGNNSTIY